MMTIPIVAIILIIANVVISYKGLKEHSFLDRYKFEVDKVLIDKEYFRLISSGFLHLDWQHLLFNMISLYAFSESLEPQIGWLNFTIIYFASLIGGDLFALLIHRNHGDYSAVGASGAVCGIIFASIAIFPGMEIGLLLIPLSIPSWMFGLFYIALTIYGIKSKIGNIGHEAHLGGALIGMAIAVILYPYSLSINYIPILIVVIPSAIFIYLILTKPQILLVDNYYFKKHDQHYTIEHRYNERKVNSQKEIDNLLDKINKKGIESLTKQEKEKLEEYSSKNI